MSAAYPSPQPTTREDLGIVLAPLSRILDPSTVSSNETRIHTSAPTNQYTVDNFRMLQQQNTHEEFFSPSEELTRTPGEDLQTPWTGCGTIVPARSPYREAGHAPDHDNYYFEWNQHVHGGEYGQALTSNGYSSAGFGSKGSPGQMIQHPFEGYEVSRVYNPHMVDRPQAQMVDGTLRSGSRDTTSTIADAYVDRYAHVDHFPTLYPTYATEPSRNPSFLGPWRQQHEIVHVDDPLTNPEGIKFSDASLPKREKHGRDLKTRLRLTPRQKSEGRKPTGIEKQPLWQRKASVKGNLKRYAALEDALTVPLPDFPHIEVQYATHDEALDDFKDRVKDLATYWTPPQNDSSIPRNDTERQAVVRTLLGAMRDTSRAADKIDSRWTEDAPRKHNLKDIEVACWEIERLAERLHIEGPSVLAIHDVNFLKTVKHSEELTFGQRIRYIAVLFLEFKSRADGLIKGQTLHDIVGAPQEALHSARTNNEANKRKANQIAFAREHQPEQALGKRKRVSSKQPILDADEKGDNDIPNDAEETPHATDTNHVDLNSDASRTRRKRARYSPRPRIASRVSRFS
ncbi:uncharacterized protein K460DRAFT_431409 [Cucurbitaria berberidis CBS 394.84]|uniref:Uncharacterized protein n=1 Tax=Cucurbitaria berberidis CBS 394.84 TaxID=1168544 RepID=A0A9P4GJ73_9PLEO|nr:uncharacterized protein K460DRAFT_431409 [Cucurbitaria berberidis CBS 394.84]KAF1846391.1 hypothetical protein K460DRAFT_431409 [Cucurbitaria berberidis CBS 394.84]